MSIPPVPNHPPRPGRRKPAEESPESITTQLFVGQPKPNDADGSTQALRVEEIEKLRAMVSADGVEATEMLSLEELRELAAESGSTETLGPTESDPSTTPTTPRKARSDDIARAEAAAAPKSWNPGQPAVQHSPNRYVQAPDPRTAQPHGRGQAPGTPSAPGYIAAAPGHGAPPSQAPAAAGYAAPGHSNPSAPDASRPDASRQATETKKVPAWLWVLATIAVIATLGIVGYIAWDSLQSRPLADGPAIGSGPATDGPDAEPSAAPVTPTKAFTSPSGNISCTIDPARVRCVIASYDYDPPDRPDDCQLSSWGSVLVANDEGAGFSCRDAAPVPTGAQVLAYGDSVKAEGMTCASTKQGMTCTADKSGIGFTIRRASVDFLD